MQYPKIQYPNKADLEAFVEECEQKLLKSKKNRWDVVYPNGTVGEGKWDRKAIKAENLDLLKTVSGKANVYAIFTASKGSNEFTPVYIGQRKRDGIRRRLTEHLIMRNEGTGAKLDNVKNHVLAGKEIRVSWILVEPESLRHYVEEELIGKCTRAKGCEWNIHGKKKR